MPVDTDKLVVWTIDPLPDFLSDPGLTGEAEPERLGEFNARWVQVLNGLASWADRATFVIRYLMRSGGVTCTFGGLAHDRADVTQLEAELGVLLRTNKLLFGSRRATSDAKKFVADSVLSRPAVVNISQHATRSLWTTSGTSLSPQQTAKIAGLSPVERDHPLVIFPWAGPDGPFLGPMESLLSQPVPVAITVLLEPTTLRPHELDWLTVMSQLSKTRSETNLQSLAQGASQRIADPTATLAARLYSDAFARLMAAAFRCTAYTAASDGRQDLAHSLANSLRGLAFVPITKSKGDSEAALPSGADITVVDAQVPHLAEQLDALRFVTSAAVDLSRVPDLVDARSAATMFRFPVSVRGGVPGIRVRQQPPDFHPGPRETVRPPDHIRLGNYYAGGIATMPLKDLRKHALITGFTGSGKTVTVLQLLHQLWVDHDVPFLVIESAKQEYRGLSTVEEFAPKSRPVRVYTIGNELCAPFRLNPFELLPGVRVEAHLGKLQSCFEGAIPPVGPSSSVIAEALLRAYDRHGWSLTDVYPRTGTARRSFPVLRDFVDEVENVLTMRGYEGEISANLKAALVGRFQPLLIGGKGRMFDSQRSSPSPAELFAGPVVLEMNDLIIEDKALVTMFLLTLLREWREIDKALKSELKHVTVVEEAHNVLEEVGSEGGGEGATKADTRYKAVQAFCTMLTEIRSLGEGLIIADQSPQKLARDAIRNTNLQIAHQLRDDEDRQSIARAMIMEDEQQEYLGKLNPGRAALFRTGLEKATFVGFEPYYPEPEVATHPGLTAQQKQHLRRTHRGFGYNPLLTDDELATYMDRVDTALPTRRKLSLPYGGCEQCKRQCAYRDPIFPMATSPANATRNAEWFALTDNDTREAAGLDKTQMWMIGVKLCQDAATHAGVGHDREAAWCYFVHLWVTSIRQARRAGGNPAVFDPSQENLGPAERAKFDAHHARL